MSRNPPDQNRWRGFGETPCCLQSRLQGIQVEHLDLDCCQGQTVLASESPTPSRFCNCKTKSGNSSSHSFFGFLAPSPSSFFRRI